MYEAACTELNDTGQKLAFKNLLIEFSSVFSKNNFDLGCYTGVEHRIETLNEIPVKEKFRRTPLAFQDQEKDYLDNLLAQGVIVESNSEWSSAPVLVRKKTGELRYCIDYRALNSKTVKDTFNIPLIEDCLDSLHGRSMFCVLDLCSGYFQIPLEAESQLKTSFGTRWGSFMWKKLPQGLCNAPASFQRAMNLVLRGLTWEELIVYLDDVILLGNSFDGMLGTLRSVFSRFKENNLKLKPSKCKFFKSQVEFLGKLVSEDGIAIAPDKLEAVKSWPVPKTAKQVLSFLGFMNYHRNHIKDFGKVSAVLYSLAHAKSFKWEEQHNDAFLQLKHAAITAPLLAHPSPEGTFILDTDASGVKLVHVCRRSRTG